MTSQFMANQIPVNAGEWKDAKAPARCYLLDAKHFRRWTLGRDQNRQVVFRRLLRGRVAFEKRRVDDGGDEEDDKGCHD